MHRPPNTELTIGDYQDIINPIKDNPILLGYLNSKSPIWGSSTTDKFGSILEELIENKNLVVLNDGSVTYTTHTVVIRHTYIQLLFHLIFQITVTVHI